MEKNAELETRIKKKNKELAESEKVHEKQQFHIETLNMMTKYQVVFLKLEASLKKIVSNNEVRDELRKRRGFMRLAENALKAHAVSQKTRALINAKTERVFGNLSKIANKLDQGVSNAFNKWRFHIECKKQEEALLYSKNKKVQTITDEISRYSKKLENLSKRKDDLDNDIKDLQARKKEQQEYLKDLEQEKQSLE